MSFIHSSELTPWSETWLVDGSGIKLTEVCYSGGGAGIPTLASDLTGGKVDVTQKGVCVHGVNRELGSKVYVALTQMKEGRLILGGGPELVVRDSPLIALEVKRASILEFLTHSFATIFEATPEV